MTSETFRGFSMVELLLVMGIITILAGLGVFGLSGFREGHALKLSRDEAALLSERARNLAVYQGDEMTLRLDPAARSFWIEDRSGNRRTDPEKVDRGVEVTGPTSLIFKGTGGLKAESAQVYTFRSERSGKTVTLRIHPKTGRAEKEGS